MTAALAGALRDGSRIVARVAQGRSLSDELARVRDDGETSRAALLDLTHGTLRAYGRGPFIVHALSRRPSSDPLVDALLWCALYALDSGRYTPYTVVDQAVSAAGMLEKWSAKGYVNAILRGYLRDKTELARRVAENLEAQTQHPAWWVEALQRAYPSEWHSVVQAGNSHPPMTLRVNRRKASVKQYEARLADHAIAATQVGPVALRLGRPLPVSRVPGFADGLVSVQDAGAQFAAGYLDLASGQRVLDACAAPGGKAGHILETADVALTALDADAVRLQRVASNLERLGLRAKLAVADCIDLGSWWDGVPFDRVLADVPCSASGIVRRHPDLKWLRRATDLSGFAARQGEILDALWQALGPGGKLLYVTCSVFPEENEAVVASFLARRPDARRLPLPDGLPAQRLPDAGQDGFFYALISRPA